MTPLIELPFALPGRIFRSPMPFGRYDPEAQVFEQYRQNGVQVVVVLAEREECLQKAGRDLPALYAEQGYEVVHLPIPDFGAPPIEILSDTVERVAALAQSGKTIAVHCYAGYGRTGMFLACLARRVLGFTGEEAIQWVRSYVPTSIEMPEQIAVVQQFDAETATSFPGYRIAMPPRPGYGPLWFGFVDESGDPSPFTRSPFVIAGVFTDDPRQLDLVARKALKKTGTPLSSGELKASSSKESFIFRVLEKLNELPLELIVVQVDKTVIVKPPKSPELIYAWAMSELVKNCVERYPRLDLRVDKRYTNPNQQQRFERWIRDELITFPNISLTIPQVDSIAQKPIQMADFIAWAAGKHAGGDPRFWKILETKVMTYRILRRPLW